MDNRVSRSVEYERYITSPTWRLRRKRFALSVRACFCAGCGAPWLLSSGDVHHLTYERLGHELDEDLMALCRGCHSEVHRYQRLHGGSIAEATRVTIARIAEQVGRAVGHGATSVTVLPRVEPKRRKRKGNSSNVDKTIPALARLAPRVGPHPGWNQPDDRERDLTAVRLVFGFDN